MRFKSLLIAGAIHGVAVWIAFGVSEIVFASVRPLSSVFYQMLTGHHWRLIGLTSAGYALAGLLLGAIAGLLLGLHKHQRTHGEVHVAEGATLQSAASLTVCTAYVVNLLIQYPSSAVEYAGVATGLVLGLVILIRLGQRLRSDQPRPNIIGEPWVIPILLLGIPWVINKFSSSASLANRAATAGAVLLAVLLVGFIGPRLLTLSRGRPGLPIRHLISALVAVPLIVGSVLAFTEQPVRTQPPSNRVSAPTAAPNIILLVLDTVRADRMSLYGYEKNTTPELIKFANEATLYKQPVAVSNHTVMTHGSMFTGLDPRTNGLHPIPPDQSEISKLNPSFQTLAETLSENGYHTFGISANTIVGEEYGLDQGFQFFDSRAPVPFIGYTTPYVMRYGFMRFLALFTDTLEFERKTRPAATINQEVFGVLDEVKDSGDPFFLFVNYMDAHDPYLPPPVFSRQFPGRDGSFRATRYRQLRDILLKRERALSERERNHLISQYDAAIAYLDSNIAALLDRLRGLELFENSLIIITSDHGESHGDHDVLMHVISVYQDQIFVPLVIKYPHQTEKTVDDSLVTQLDYLPTILAIAGIKEPAGHSGRDLREPCDSDSRIAISTSWTLLDDRQLRPDWPLIEWSVIKSRTKLISSSNGTEQLYDLETDPREQRGIERANHPAYGVLSAELEHWLENTPEYKTTSTEEPDPAALELLRSLGYIK